MDQDVQTGVSIMELHEEHFDAGRILKQTSLDVPPNAFFSDLQVLLANQGAEDMLQVLKNIPSFKESAWEQDVKMVSLAPKLGKEMGSLILETMTAKDIYARFRAFDSKVIG
jgi:methionyl-tRNA formyltransferase